MPVLSIFSSFAVKALRRAKKRGPENSMSPPSRKLLPASGTILSPQQIETIAAKLEARCRDVEY